MCVRKKNSKSEDSAVWMSFQCTLEPVKSHPARYASFGGDLIVGNPINEQLNCAPPALDGVPQIGIFDDLLINGWPSLEIEEGTLDGVE
jgi:hypothetical protein